MKTELIAGSATLPINPPMTFPLPKGKRVRVQSVSVTLTTSATVANRLLTIQAASKGVLVWEATSPYNVAENLTRKHSAAIGSPNTGDPSGTRYNIPLPDVWIPPDATLRVLVDNPDAGDTFANAVAIVETED